MSEDDAGRSGSRDREESPGLGFSLPPISLPEVRLPERVRLFFPIPEPPERVGRPVQVRLSRAVLAAGLLDVLDALAVGWAGPTTLPWVRGALGVVASTVLVGPPGLLYAWELLAVLGGYGWLALAPTVTVLVLARAVLRG